MAMTAFPIDLRLGETSTPAAIAAALAAVRPGEPTIINVIAGAGQGGAGQTLVAGLAEAIMSRPATQGVNLRFVNAGALGDDPVALAQGFARAAAAAGVPFGVDLVPDADADVAQSVIDGSGALKALAERTAALSAGGIKVRWLVPLVPSLVYRLDGLFSFATAAGAEPVLMSASALEPMALILAGDDRLFAWDFLTYRILGPEIDSLDAARIAAYRDMQAGLAEAGAGRAQDWGIVSAAGDYREAVRADCRGAAALMSPRRDGPPGRSRAEVLREKVGDFADVLGGGSLAFLRSAVAGTNTPGRARARMQRVLLIGAYGGEHIGDAAILGGVIGRIHKAHGTTSAILMTQRVAHTRHLVPMLDVPATIEVREYTFANIRRALDEVDGVVFAGGPLTDLPKQLVRHLETVSRARRRGLPFIMEGIGPGTFVRKPSELAARRLVTMADKITIRTSDDLKRPVIAGCKVEVGRDPAFDYLETRGPRLTRLPDKETGQIAALLEGAGNRPLIGINIRPIGHLFTVAPQGTDAATYTRQVEARFETEFARGLAAYAAAAPVAPRFIYFPMNAIQFGMSDMACAWRIMQHLPAGTDFRIWEADASLDGVISLMRQLDTVISMRFHGVIYALSQGCQVIGIDYRIGKRDKVAAVLSDAGQEENCSRIDELRAEWLSARLLSFAPKIRGGDGMGSPG